MPNSHRGPSPSNELNRMASVQDLRSHGHELHLSPPARLLNPSSSPLFYSSIPLYSKDQSHLSVKLAKRNSSFWEPKTLTDLGSNPDDLDRVTSLGSPPAVGEEKNGGQFIWSAGKEETKAGLQLTSAASFLAEIKDGTWKLNLSDQHSYDRISLKLTDKIPGGGKPVASLQLLPNGLHIVKEERANEQSPVSSPEGKSPQRISSNEGEVIKRHMMKLKGLLEQYLTKHMFIKMKNAISPGQEAISKTKVIPMIMITTPDKLEVPNSSIAKFKGDSMTELITLHAQKPQLSKIRVTPAQSFIQEIEDKEDSDSKGPAVLSRRISSESSESHKYNLSARLLALERVAKDNRVSKPDSPDRKPEQVIEEIFQPKGLFKSVLAFKKLFEKAEIKKSESQQDATPIKLGTFQRSPERELRPSRSATTFGGSYQPSPPSRARTIRPQAPTKGPNMMNQKPDGARNLRTGVLAMTFYKKLNRFAKRTFVKKTLVNPETTNQANRINFTNLAKTETNKHQQFAKATSFSSHESPKHLLNRSPSNDSNTHPKLVRKSAQHHSSQPKLSQESNALRARKLSEKLKRADDLKSRLLTSVVPETSIMIEAEQRVDPLPARVAESKDKGLGNPSHQNPPLVVLPPSIDLSSTGPRLNQKRLSDVSHVSAFTFLRAHPGGLHLPGADDTPATIGQRKKSYNLWDFSFADSNPNMPQSPTIGLPSRSSGFSKHVQAFKERPETPKKKTSSASGPGLGFGSSILDDPKSITGGFLGYEYLFAKNTKPEVSTKITEPSQPEDDVEILPSRKPVEISQGVGGLGVSPSPNSPTKESPRKKVANKHGVDQNKGDLMTDSQKLEKLSQQGEYSGTPRTSQKPTPDSATPKQLTDLCSPGATGQMKESEAFLGDSVDDIDKDFDVFIKSHRELEDRQSEHSSLTMDILAVEPSAKESPNSRSSPHGLRDASSIGGIFPIGRDHPEIISPTSPRKYGSEIGSISKSIHILRRKVGTDSMREISSKIEPADNPRFERSAIVSISKQVRKVAMRRGSGNVPRGRSVESVGDNRIRIRRIVSQDIVRVDAHSATKIPSNDTSINRLERNYSQAYHIGNPKREESLSKISVGGSPAAATNQFKKTSDSSVLASKTRNAEKTSPVSRAINQDGQGHRDSFSIKPIAGHDIFVKRIKKAGNPRNSRKFKFPGEQSYSITKMGQPDGPKSSLRNKELSAMQTYQKDEGTMQPSKSFIEKEDDGMSSKSNMSDKILPGQIDEVILEKRRRLKYLEEIGKAAGKLGKTDEKLLDKEELQNKLQEFGAAIPTLFVNAGIGFGKGFHQNPKHIKASRKIQARKKPARPAGSFHPIALGHPKNPSALELLQTGGLPKTPAYIAVGHKSEMNINYQPRSSVQYDRNAHNNSNISAFKAIPDDNLSPSKADQYGSDNVLVHPNQSLNL